MVSLWDMLTLLSGPSTFGVALAAARLQGGGGFRLGVGVLLSAGLGVLAVAAAHVGGERALRRLRPEDDSPRTHVRLRVLYVAKVAWVLVAPFLGFWIVDGILRVAFP